MCEGDACCLPFQHDRSSTSHVDLRTSGLCLRWLRQLGGLVQLVHCSMLARFFGVILRCESFAIPQTYNWLLAQHGGVNQLVSGQQALGALAVCWVGGNFCLYPVWIASFDLVTLRCLVDAMQPGGAGRREAFEAWVTK